MKKFLGSVCLVTLLISCGGNSIEDRVDIGNDTTNLEESFQDNTLLKNDIAAYKTVVNVIRETGLAQNFVILPGNVEKVTAFINDNERVLEYNPEFMQTLEGDTNWHGISILAREIGHHLSNHDLKDGEASIEEELEADKYAGFVLQKMGASLDEAITALEKAVSENNASKSSLNARLASLSSGWKNSQSLSEDNNAIIASVDNNQKVTISVEDPAKEPTIKIQDKPKYAYQIFLAVDTSFYFINDNNIIFSENNGKYINVGEKKDSNKPGFDWIFVKGQDSYGVDVKGRLWAFSFDGNFHVVGQALKLD
jgi:hypothetical protein